MSSASRRHNQHQSRRNLNGGVLGLLDDRKYKVIEQFRDVAVRPKRVVRARSGQGYKLISKKELESKSTTSQELK